jgi:transcription antitermination protein NusB
MSNADAAASTPRRQGRGSRRSSRELVLQALYQWLLNGDEVQALLTQTAEKEAFARADQGFLQTLLHGVIERAPQLEEAVQPFLDRPVGQLSPIERALLLMAAYELTVSLDVPYRVVINEAVELAKAYGGTDGYKYVNGVLDKLAAQVRPSEVKKS